MTDLHTHILPAMDDGSKSVDESLRMLAAQRAQGVDTVYLTPHFYPEREDPAAFLRRRAASFGALRSALPENAPTLHLGAEVAWFPTIHKFDALEDLRLGDSRYFLLELPFQPWGPRLLDGLYQIPDRLGLTPVLAHVERYLSIQEKKTMEELFSLGLPMQMTSSALMARRWKMTRLLKRGDWVMGSDCHNMTSRPPDMGKAGEYLRRKLGRQAGHMLNWRPADAE